MRNPKARDSDRLRAAEILLDRGHGKPRQELEHTGKDGTDLVPEMDRSKVALALLDLLTVKPREADGVCTKQLS
jgi:hypothetical protein